MIIKPSPTTWRIARIISSEKRILFSKEDPSLATTDNSQERMLAQAPPPYRSWRDNAGKHRAKQLSSFADNFIKYNELQDFLNLRPFRWNWT